MHVSLVNGRPGANSSSPELQVILIDFINKCLSTFIIQNYKMKFRAFILHFLHFFDILLNIFAFTIIYKYLRHSPELVSFDFGFLGLGHFTLI